LSQKKRELSETTQQLGICDRGTFRKKERRISPKKERDGSMHHRFFEEGEKTSPGEGGSATSASIITW